MKKTDSPTPPTPTQQESREPPKPSPLVKLRRTPTPSRQTPNLPTSPDVDYDEFRDDNINDPAEQELAAVFANDKESTKDDDRFDLTSPPAPASKSRARSSIDFLNKSAAGKNTPEKPPSRSHTPGTLAANKLKMFGNYNLGERAESRGPTSDRDGGGDEGNGSDLEVVSPLPPEDVTAVSKKTDDKEGRRSKTPSRSDALSKNKGGPGKLQFQMKQKPQAKKAVKTGSLNLSKFSKFGKGSAVFKSRDEEDVSTPPKKAPTADVKRKPTVELDGNVPSAEEYKMKRRQKSMDADGADPFDGIPQTTEKQQDDSSKDTKISGFQRKPVAELEDVSKEEFKIKRRPRSIMDDEEMIARDDVVDPFEGIPQTEGK